MSNLRSELIKLAYAHPELQDKLDPVLRTFTAAKPIRLKKDIKLRDRTFIEKGTEVTVVFDPNRPSLALLKIETRPEPVKVSTIHLHDYLEGFKMPPSRAQLAKWLASGRCQSVRGQSVAIDDWDQYGSPSWLLVLGLV